MLRINQSEHKWLQDLLSTASATVIQLVSGECLLVELGDLSEGAFRKLHKIINANWSGFANEGINRYMGIALDGRYRLLYVKALPQPERLLGLVFPLQAPLIRIRQDMTDILREMSLLKLHNPDNFRGMEQSLQLRMSGCPENDGTSPSRREQAGWELEINQRTDQTEDQVWREEPIIQPDEKGNKETNTKQLDDVIMHKDNVVENAPQDCVSNAKDIVMNEMPWQPLSELQGEDGDLVSLLQEDYELGHVADEIIEVKPGSQPLTPSVSHAEIPTSDDTVPTPSANREPPDLKVVSEITFYLLPRQEGHHISEELSQKLRNWIAAICEIYGWELDCVVLRPTYIRWTLVDFPECLTRDMIKTIRQATSTRIFQSFPHLQSDPHVNDFWSPGDLVDTQNRNFSTQALVAHISKIDKGQNAPGNRDE